jgi:hypothetical protein
VFDQIMKHCQVLLMWLVQATLIRCQKQDSFQVVGTKALTAYNTGKYEEAYQGFLICQKLQPFNVDIFIAAGQVKFSVPLKLQ